MDRRMKEYQEKGHPSDNPEIFELEMDLHNTLAQLRLKLWEQVHGDKEIPRYSELSMYRHKKRRKKF